MIKVLNGYGDSDYYNELVEKINKIKNQEEGYENIYKIKKEIEEIVDYKNITNEKLNIIKIRKERLIDSMESLGSEKVEEYNILEKTLVKINTLINNMETEFYRKVKREGPLRHKLWDLCRNNNMDDNELLFFYDIV